MTAIQFLEDIFQQGKEAYATGDLQAARRCCNSVIALKPVLKVDFDLGQVIELRNRSSADLLRKTA